jgi:DNA-directed RNA polymerase subunit RPC12/RpoP
MKDYESLNGMYSIESNCKYCGWEIINLNLTVEQIKVIQNLVSQNRKLHAVKKMMDDFGINHVDSKGIVSHLNKDFGICHRCSFDKLKHEYIECPKCKSFNYNLKPDI